MKRFFPIALSLVLALSICVAASLHAADGKKLSPEGQKAFLAKRTSGIMLGSFDGYCSLLYAAREVAIHTESEEIDRTMLSPSFPEFYKPTWNELFDAIARQTKSTWKYDADRDYWVFSKPESALPYKIELAEKWNADDRGLYVSYHPTTAPVGLDIYMMGTYSISEKEDQAKLFNKVRDAIALQFARHFKEDVTPKDMEEVKINDLKALHFKIAAAETGVIWRQWIIVDSGMAFAVVSAIKPENEKDILPDVEKMVKSFKIPKADDKKTDPPKKNAAK